MPPRSVCLNVFTTSLGDRKDAVESVRDVDVGKEVMDGVLYDRKDGGSMLEKRHDSMQSSPEDLVASSNTLSTSTDNILSVSQALACVTCGNTSTSTGTSLLRCSRCKTTFYCSRICQRTDWNSHKKLCSMSRGGSQPAQSPPSMSVPASPVHSQISAFPVSDASVVAGSISGSASEAPISTDSDEMQF
ncbi:hypothetical protein BDV95DRAFT_595804 [Massariosphaeria phaeospora]|uniref:MYND-type domain-containing protein n=1 Tax=Massariosphaeria phaeospora TaxID=100035 RepID=A0A7C8M8G0_9PLEO|nr:hypothetical protein BDV95DRAFT_595804 [Massariosphaeria phaeospora]